MALERATLGAGCLWRSEAYFREIDGVFNTRVRHSTGSDGITPSARIEVVQIDFDNAIISFNELIESFGAVIIRRAMIAKVTKAVKPCALQSLCMLLLSLISALLYVIVSMRSQCFQQRRRSLSLTGLSLQMTNISDILIRTDIMHVLFPV